MLSVTIIFTFPPGAVIPLPVDPSEDASEEPIDDDSEAVLLALLC